MDVKWAGYPRSYTSGRRRPIQFIVLHYTAGAEGPETAEAGASYDKRRTDGTSTHYFTDSLGPPVQEVPDGDRAHSARFHGNEIGVQIEICGTRQTRAQWLDATSTATLRTTAELTAMLCRRHDLPVRRLTTAQTRAAYYAAAGSRPKGITDHNACTFAFPEDGGDHTDVGPAFPWDVFMGWVQEFYDAEGDMSILGLKQGDTGERVKLLHRLLKTVGFPVPAADYDAGKYGTGTSEAVLAMRRALGSRAESGAAMSADAVEQLERHRIITYASAVAITGPKGDPGPAGPAGPPGKDGASVAVGALLQVSGALVIEDIGASDQ